MDALYILGNGSKFKNAELRYSLRTLERFIPEINRVIVVGENPGFLSPEVEFYKVPEAPGNKEFRIAKKIEYACAKDIVTGNFLFLNDDFFFTKPINPKTYPYYYKGSLDLKKVTRMYQRSVKNTATFLKDQGKPFLNYDIHTPIIYNAQDFLNLAWIWQQSQKLNAGYVVKSIYANMYNKPGKLQRDTKLNRLKAQDDFLRLTKTNCMSCSDVGWLKGVQAYLKEHYPNPSKYEL